MRRWIWRWARRAVVLAALLVLTVPVVRAVQAWMAAPLEPWHTYIAEEPDAAQLVRMDWAAWMEAEARVFAGVARDVTAVVARRAPDLGNRYDPRSPMHTPRFTTDWNRSFVLEPEGRPRGAAVLIHGLTDAPYSLRHLAGLYRAHGFTAIAMRMPGHGTVPGGLTQAVWEDWAAAVRVGMREARRRLGPEAPIHLIGYSNGGALAMLHALDALGDSSLVRPDRIVLVSPMIGVSPFARLAGLAGLPALLPAFAPAAWLSTLPEFNPFKYNSFPVNAGAQSARLTAAVQARMQAAGRAGRLGELPFVLTFQSLVDSTVLTRAVIERLHAQLPEGRSELVLFDQNRAAGLEGLIRPAFHAQADSHLPPAPRPFTATIVTNANPATLEMVARTTRAGARESEERALGVAYPREMYSLSHIALPFPAADSLYGGAPQPPREFGISLGAAAPRGETGMLVMSLDSLARVSWNPFFASMIERIAAEIQAR
jgi:alpha-beta hydrolase superfamily lysophospholipase